MIKFVCGELKGDTNATVTLFDETHEAAAVRDDDGNVTVTLDATEPEPGDPVTLVLHGENDATFEGVLDLVDGEYVFVR